MAMKKKRGGPKSNWFLISYTGSKKEGKSQKKYWSSRDWYSDEPGSRPRKIKVKKTKKSDQRYFGFTGQKYSVWAKPPKSR
jgi:hypothetical protein